MNAARSYQAVLKVLAVTFLALPDSTSTAQDRFAKYVEQLTGTNSEAAADAAVSALWEAGTNAFPTLLAHLNDYRRYNGDDFREQAGYVTVRPWTNQSPFEASKSLKTINPDEVMNAPSEVFSPSVSAFFGTIDLDSRKGEKWNYYPDLGEVCFKILRGQIEGGWYKAYRPSYVLKPDNIVEWLKKHSHLTLAQLRVEAAKEALQNAEVRVRTGGVDEKFVEFFKKNLAKNVAALETLGQNTNAPPGESSKSNNK